MGKLLAVNQNYISSNLICRGKEEIAEALNIEMMAKTIRKENPVISLINNMLIDLPSPSNISYF